MITKTPQMTHVLNSERYIRYSNDDTLKFTVMKNASVIPVYIDPTLHDIYAYWYTETTVQYWNVAPQYCFCAKTDMTEVVPSICPANRNGGVAVSYRNVKFQAKSKFLIILFPSPVALINGFLVDDMDVLVISTLVISKL